ncbi:UDP-N-acetylmuramoyl-L-alanine--D-glutamate ligase [Thermoactinomyces mirandus]|uniref:UDP-N-acetylmuramoylalanine--D-glutamate ligase n=1 Tax=Thermoactinomyces mirandus TaxID=2756294 RepID=A0A7W2AQ61_9BACL|nr:UDP-N-acetylmuramoyl-L-alanine--D-glutamate ligase [Thermoactinomyces mirandus]MBA4601163.1 UDP-N-acetylmuramoyl-L-alanine--D-glutamate ligase [Thermoactinomyces mirandus]
MKKTSEWAGRYVIVLGLARSGVAVAKLLNELEAKVLVNDCKPREQCPEADELEMLGIPVLCGGHPDDLVSDEVDLLVKNPGIPYHAKPIVQAIKKGIPVITEVEIAGALSEAPIIGITGSNGKTTTTTLVGEMLSKSGVKNKVAGNIGQALADVVKDSTEDEWLVAELSSFQLKGTRCFKPKAASLLNIYPAHLDYHQDMEDYFSSKLKLFQNQTAEEVAVLNLDHPYCRQAAEQIQSDIWWFSRLQEVPKGVFVREETVIAKYSDSREEPVIPVSEIALRGDFNLENVLAAIALSLVAGANVAGICEVLKNFPGVEHRLEYVAAVNDVRYYNDSKATNPQAATKALESFAEPVIWIGGGLDRGIDFKEMVPVFRKRVKAMIAYGQTRDILIERGREAELKEVHAADDLKSAVEIASRLAGPGDVVLLSPACASWDQYTSFEERGSIFKQTVHNLQI